MTPDFFLAWNELVRYARELATTLPGRHADEPLEGAARMIELIERAERALRIENHGVATR